MATTPTPDLLREFRRRHVVIAKAIALSAAALLGFVFLVVLRNLVIAELEKVRDTAFSLLRTDPSGADLAHYCAHLQGYYLYIKTDRATFQSKTFEPDQPFLERVDQAQQGDHSSIMMVNGYLKIGLIHKGELGTFCLLRSDNPVPYYTMMGLIVLSILLILFFFTTRGHRYLIDPVVAEMQWFQELDRAKERFFASIFHELGTPLTSLMTRLETLIERDPPQPQRRELELAYLDAQRISLTSSEQLQRSRFEAGTFSLHREQVHIDELFEIVQIRMDLLLKHNQNTLQIEPCDLCVFADRWKLEQALVNLLTNAIKYGGPGPIRLSATAHTGEIWLEVHDQGRGFDPAWAAELIQPFRQRTATQNPGLESTGLGLYLVDHIAQAHAGSLSFHRQADGFTARISLPEPTDQPS